MSEAVRQHLDAIEEWIRRQGEAVPDGSEVLTTEERKQLQAVNKTIQQLANLGVTVPPDLREIKLRLSAKQEESSDKNPVISERAAALDSVSDSLKALGRLAKATSQGLKTPSAGSGAKRHFGVQVRELIDGGF